MQKVYLDEALALAKKAEDLDEVPVGAVVVKEGEIIGRGYNRRESDKNPLAHAENQAILEASRKLGNWRLLECELVVTLEPCPMCLASCQQARVREVHYAAKDSKGGALSLGYSLHEDKRMNHRFSVNYVADSRCEEMMSAFFRKKRQLKRLKARK